MQQGKIFQLAQATTDYVYSTIFNTVDFVIESTATFIHSYTQILSVQDLEKVLFILFLFFSAKLLISAFADTMYFANRAFRSIVGTKLNTTSSINGNQGKALKPRLNAQNLFNNIKIKATNMVATKPKK